MAILKEMREVGFEISPGPGIQRWRTWSARAISCGAATSSRAGSARPTADNTLPGTASPLPFVGLLGLLSLAGGFAIRFVRA